MNFVKACLGLEHQMVPRNEPQNVYTIKCCLVSRFGFWVCCYGNFKNASVWLGGDKVEIATEGVCQLEPAAMYKISGSLKTIYMSFAEPPLVFLQECRI